MSPRFCTWQFCCSWRHGCSIFCRWNHTDNHGLFAHEREQCAMFPTVGTWWVLYQWLAVEMSAREVEETTICTPISWERVTKGNVAQLRQVESDVATSNIPLRMLSFLEDELAVFHCWLPCWQSWKAKSRIENAAVRDLRRSLQSGSSLWQQTRFWNLISNDHHPNLSHTIGEWGIGVATEKNDLVKKWF